MTGWRGAKGGPLNVWTPGCSPGGRCSSITSNKTARAVSRAEYRDPLRRIAMSARFASKSLWGRLLGAITIVVLLVTAVPTPTAYAASVHVDSVSVSGPSGTVTYGTPGTVSYTVTVLCAGNGGGI